VCVCVWIQKNIVDVNDDGSIFVIIDERIKKNIVDVNDDTALDKFLTIQPKTYEYQDVVK
jgi:hypothetical protein